MIYRFRYLDYDAWEEVPSQGCAVAAAHILTGRSVQSCVRRFRKITGRVTAPRGGISNKELWRFLGLRKYDLYSFGNEEKVTVGGIMMGNFFRSGYDGVMGVLLRNGRRHCFAVLNRVIYDTRWHLDLPYLRVRYVLRRKLRRDAAGVGE